MEEQGQTESEAKRVEQLERRLNRQTERLDTFTSVISHDLRNPLNVAQSSVELLEEDSSHVDRLDRSLNSIAEIIEKADQYVKQKEPVESTSPVNVPAVAKRVWENPADGVLETDIKKHVMADPERLSVLFDHLFRNSVEHSEGPVTVHIGELPDGFYVADDGPGIPEGDRDDVFEPGYTVNRHGTGLGLAIVRDIARAHGWSVKMREGDTGGLRVEVTGVERQ